MPDPRVSIARILLDAALMRVRDGCDVDRTDGSMVIKDVTDDNSATGRIVGGKDHDRPDRSCSSGSGDPVEDPKTEQDD